LSDIKFSLGNKREYINGDYYDLLTNDNFHLNILFEANIYNFNPNNKIFLQINNDEYNSFLLLINKIKNNINQNVISYDSLYIGKNNSNNKYVLAKLNKNNNDIIYTNIYKLTENKLKKIDIDSVPNNFRAIITIRIKSLLEKDENWLLDNDIYQLVIKNEIMLENNNLDIIKDFLF
jgi:hypothetical protein